MITVEDIHGKPRANRNHIPIHEHAPIAHNIQDSMSFAEAFSTARQEVGAGGAFVWRGNVYDTYYREEWDLLSALQREQYNESVHLETDEVIEITSDNEVVLPSEPVWHEVPATDEPLWTLEDNPSDEQDDPSDYQPII